MFIIFLEEFKCNTTHFRFWLQKIQDLFFLKLCFLWRSNRINTETCGWWTASSISKQFFISFLFYQDYVWTFDFWTLLRISLPLKRNSNVHKILISVFVSENNVRLVYEKVVFSYYSKITENCPISWLSTNQRVKQLL